MTYLAIKSAALLCIAVYAALRFKYELQMMQQNSYRTARYLRWLKKRPELDGPRHRPHAAGRAAAFLEQYLGHWRSRRREHTQIGKGNRTQI
ncbi:MAG: hypothetical protein L6V35_03810 [Alistipes putredinis]|nr:MAG: hypothetical protein L6V35_03810 [Alistipes putredinis]